MDVLSILVEAISFVASEGAKGVVAEGAKDACRSVKEFLGKRYPKVDLVHLNQASVSDARRAVVVEDLTTSGAAADPDFAPLAKRLIDAVAEAVRTKGAQTGIELHDFEAASLLIDGVIARGQGVTITKGKFAGHAEFRNVRAGVDEGSAPKKA